MARQRNQQNQLQGQMAMLQQMGLLQDPLQELSGLVNLVNGLSQDDRQGEQLQLQKDELTQRQTQFSDGQGLARDQMALTEKGQQGQEDRWLQEFQAQEKAREAERIYRAEQAKVGQTTQDRAYAMDLLGLPARYINQSSGMMNPDVDPSALNAAIPEGLAGLASFLKTKPAADSGIPASFNIDQRIVAQNRKKIGL